MKVDVIDRFGKTKRMDRRYADILVKLGRVAYAPEPEPPQPQSKAKPETITKHRDRSSEAEGHESLPQSAAVSENIDTSSTADKPKRRYRRRDRAAED